MRTWLPVCLAALAVGCGSDTAETDRTFTNGRVEFQDIEVEGGVWLIRSENGTLYRPNNMPDGFKVVGARVQVTLIERRGLTSPGLPGVPVVLLSIEEAPCGRGTCGVTPPP